MPSSVTDIIPYVPCVEVSAHVKKKSPFVGAKIVRGFPLGVADSASSFVSLHPN